MGRSPSFGSICSDCNFALLKLGFPSASYIRVFNLATTNNSPDRSTKSTQSHIYKYSASTACKHRVSGSLSLPSRGSFHLSFTVLYTIGHRGVFRLMGWSPRVPARFLVSRSTLDPARCRSISSTGLSPSMAYCSKIIRL